MSSLKKYFKGIAWKYLSAVDASSSKKSTQHEIGSNEFIKILGNPGKDTLRPNAQFLYFPANDDEDGILRAEEAISFYNTRRHKSHRSPEYRLYYSDNPVTLVMAKGDFCLIGVRPNGELLVIITPQGTAVERRIRYLFGMPKSKSDWRVSDAVDDKELDFSSRTILSALGIELADRADELLGKLVDEFGYVFPTTKIFSAFARKHGPKDLNAVRDADAALEGWMAFEEKLFRTLEREIVEKQIKKGFKGVDEFVKFSLSVQNRRKSRVGHALENHLEAVFLESKVQYSRGQKTEGNAKPDFLFPGVKQYHDQMHVSPPLRMLAAKTTCKDRWRQILAEADRIKTKHLFTLETAISSNQTNEMKKFKVKLVAPTSVIRTYEPAQQVEILTLRQFVGVVR